MAKEFSSESRVAVSSHVCLVSFKLGEFLNYFFDFHYLDTFEVYRPVILKNVLQFELVQCFLMIRSLAEMSKKQCGVLIASYQVA